MISIHALLAESDVFGFTWLASCAYFYPRSPCGERHLYLGRQNPERGISIHALLAESDLRVVDGSKSSIISIHALLAESDSRRYPVILGRGISIHALLAESDMGFFYVFDFEL